MPTKNKNGLFSDVKKTRYFTRRPDLCVNWFKLRKRCTSVTWTIPRVLLELNSLRRLSQRIDVFDFTFCYFITELLGCRSMLFSQLNDHWSNADKSISSHALFIAYKSLTMNALFLASVASRWPHSARPCLFDRIKIYGHTFSPCIGLKDSIGWRDSAAIILVINSLHVMGLPRNGEFIANSWSLCITQKLCSNYPDWLYKVGLSCDAWILLLRSGKAASYMLLGTRFVVCHCGIDLLLWSIEYDRKKHVSKIKLEARQIID